MITILSLKIIIFEDTIIILYLYYYIIVIVQLHFLSNWSKPHFQTHYSQDYFFNNILKLHFRHFLPHHRASQYRHSETEKVTITLKLIKMELYRY